MIENPFGLYFKTYFVNSDTENLLVVEPQLEGIDPAEFLSKNYELIEQYIFKYGGILFRNFNINSLSQFNKFALSLTSELLNYIYRSTPRTLLGGKIYTATEYPPDRHIPLHNENSYSLSWPNKIMFFCAIPPTENGETPVADSRRVYKSIDKDIIKKFTKLGVMYVRNYRNGIDLSWQEVFQTNNQDDVNKFCKDNSICYEWSADGSSLKTKQVCQAVLEHPVTKELTWFNQAHLFHISSLAPEAQSSLLSEFGEENLPRNAYYGDGSALEAEALDHIREAYEKNIVKFPWAKGDIMLLDNILMAHGRMPYTGERKIAVAMA